MDRGAWAPATAAGRPRGVSAFNPDACERPGSSAPGFLAPTQLIKRDIDRLNASADDPPDPTLSREESGEGQPRSGESSPQLTPRASQRLSEPGTVEEAVEPLHLLADKIWQDGTEEYEEMVMEVQSSWKEVAPVQLKTAR